MGLFKKRFIDHGENDYDNDYMYDEYEEEAQATEVDPRDNIRALANRPPSILMCKPVSIDQKNQIVEELRRGKIINLNTHKLDADVAQRMLDYLQGAAFALRATIFPLSDTVFSIVPHGIKTFGEMETAVEYKQERYVGVNGRVHSKL